MKLTITVVIGNTDNKLTQQEWGEFVGELELTLSNHRADIHFSGGPSGWALWQNYCVVFIIEDTALVPLIEELVKLRKQFRQDSIAFLWCFHTEKSI